MPIVDIKDCLGYPQHSQLCAACEKWDYVFGPALNFCELLYKTIFICGGSLKDHVVQPTTIAIFLAYKCNNFCVISNDFHSEAGVFKLMKTFGAPLFDCPL